MAKNTSAKSKATVEFKELVDLDSTPYKEGTSNDGTADLTPNSDDLPLASSILPAIGQERRITRKPGASVAESTKAKLFSQSRLDQLFARWDNGAEAFWASYQERCEIVYEIQKETAKPG